MSDFPQKCPTCNGTGVVEPLFTVATMKAALQSYAGPRITFGPKAGGFVLPREFVVHVGGGDRKLGIRRLKQINFNDVASWVMACARPEQETDRMQP